MLTADNVTITLDLVAVNENVAEVKLTESTLIQLEQAETILLSMKTDKKEVMEEIEVNGNGLSIRTSSASKAESG